MVQIASECNISGSGNYMPKPEVSKLTISNFKGGIFFMTLTMILTIFLVFKSFTDESLGKYQPLIITYCIGLILIYIYLLKTLMYMREYSQKRKDPKENEIVTKCPDNWNQDSKNPNICKDPSGTNSDIDLSQDITYEQACTLSKDKFPWSAALCVTN